MKVKDGVKFAAGWWLFKMSLNLVVGAVVLVLLYWLATGKL